MPRPSWRRYLDANGRRLGMLQLGDDANKPIATILTSAGARRLISVPQPAGVALPARPFAAAAKGALKAGRSAAAIVPARAMAMATTAVNSKLLPTSRDES